MTSYFSQGSEKPVINVRKKSPPPATPRVELQDAKPSSHSIFENPELVLQTVKLHVGDVIPALGAALEKSEKEKRQLKADVKRLTGVLRELGGCGFTCLRNDWDISAHHSMFGQEHTSREHDGIGNTSHL